MRFAWFCCGVTGGVDEGLVLSGRGVVVGPAEIEEPVRNVCVAKKSELEVVMAALPLEDAVKNAAAWLWIYKE